MKEAVFLILLCYEVFCAKILEYKFGLNYGEVFTDYTNNNHDAVNGDHYSDRGHNTIATDRGAYFTDDNNALVNLPPNDWSTSSTFTLPSTFTINTWILPVEIGYIFTRFVPSTIYISILTSTNFDIQINVGSQQCKSSVSTFNLSKIQLDNWILVSGTLEGTTASMYLNSVSQCSVALSSNYSDSPSYFASIGNYLADNGKVSFSGFMWYFVIDDGATYTSYIVASGSTCIVTGCTSTAGCSPGIVGLSTISEGCIPNINDYNKNVNGIQCNTIAGCGNDGCNTTTCLTYGTNSPYTYYINSVVTCSGATYLSGSSCLNCYSDCATCNQTSICLTCIATNANPTSTLGCACNTSYYNQTSLRTSSSCISCYSDCSTCTEAYKCTSCKASNAVADTNMGCVCSSKYYNITSLITSSSCIACYSDCATCNQALICLTCTTTYASPTTTIGCQCNIGYYNTSSLISSSSCILCYSECSSCTQAYKCTGCKASNSIIDANIGCVCPPRYYNTTSLSTGLCLPCYLECSSCNASNICLTCIASNSYPASTQGCLCNSGYYGSSALTTSSSCTKCYSECSACTNSSACSACIDPNAYPSSTGCVCKSKYGGIHPLDTNSSCVICNDECSSCNQTNLCIQCKAQFASPGTIGCACLPNYQGTHPLNSSDSCYACNSDCAYCDNVQTCINCTDPHAIPSSVSGCNCKSGYYYDSNRKCQPCSLNCLTCSNNSSCIECNGTNTLISSSNFCDCTQGYYAASRLPTICSPCDSLCKACTSGNNCSKCVDNAFLQESRCYCQLGYIESLAACVLNYFTAYVDVDSNNVIKITFSENPSIYLKSQDFDLEINGTTFSWTFSELNSDIYYIYLKFTTDVAQNTQLNITILKYPLYSHLGSQLLNYYYQVNLSSYSYPVSASIQAIAGMTSGGAKAATSTAVASALVGNPASSWVLINTIQFIIYLPLNDNPLTPGLKTFFNSFGGYNMIPNIMPYIFDSNSTSAPYTEASNFGFNTSVFWINAGPTFIVLLFLISLLPFIYLMSKVEVRKKTLKLEKYLGNYRYGIFLRFWIQAYLDLGIFSLVQLKSVAYDVVPGYFNIGSATITIVRFTQILLILTPSGIFVSSFISYSRIVDKTDETYHKKFGSLFSEFKNNRGFLSTQYYLVFFIRRISYILSQVYLNSFPFIQAGVNIGFSIIQTSYLLYYTPFKEQDVLFSCITGEICVLIVLSLTTFFLGSIEPDLSYILETICVYTVLGCMGIQFIVSVYSVIKTVKKILVKIMKYRALAFIENYEKTVRHISNVDNTTNSDAFQLNL